MVLDFNSNDHIYNCTRTKKVTEIAKSRLDFSTSLDLFSFFLAISTGSIPLAWLEIKHNERGALKLPDLIF